MNGSAHPAGLVLAWAYPAADWFAAAPIGNGRLGAMIFGGTAEARLQINDSTVWSGTPHGPAEGVAAVLAGGAGPERLEKVRQAIRARDYRCAEALLMTFEGRYSQEYLPFADLWMSLEAPGPAAYQGRTLNLDNGIAGEAMSFGGRRVERLAWASRPAGVICVTVTATGGTLGMRLRLTSPLRTVYQETTEAGLTLGTEIPVDGAPRHEPGVAEPLRYADSPVNGVPRREPSTGKPLRYADSRVDGAPRHEPGAAGPPSHAATRVGDSPGATPKARPYDPFGAIAATIATDGQVIAADGEWSVRGMTHALITLASSTSAGDLWPRLPGEPATPARSRAGHIERAATHAKEALQQGADMLKKTHEDDLRTLLGGASLAIGGQRGRTVDVQSEILAGTDERLTATVMFQLGRYLLASASRPGAGPPANLQGIWNADIRPPWSSNYTLNINTEMNYWGAEPAGLPECHLPLFDLTERLCHNGRAVSRGLYGARGWVAHHNTDMWGWALPVGMGHGAPSWAIWMMGGVWLAHHVWEHFEFGGDTAFLRERGWPVLRGCAEFCLDWLTPGADGALDTIPSTSPENLFLADGRPEALSYSAAMDMALIRALFGNCLRAAEVLNADDPLLDEIRAALPRLRPPRVTRHGVLAEWAEDHAEHDPAHRHLSPLAALYPLGQIDPGETPELAAAARRLLDRRGPGAMGWSWAWKIACRARLGDAAAARVLLREATRPLDGDPGADAPPDGPRWGGLLPNLLSTHPPFQIDGNCGLTAAIAEMILQSHGGVVRVLPALPAEWPNGTAQGLRCRGGVEADLSWRGGELATLTLRRRHGDGRVRVRYGPHETEVTLRPGEESQLGPGLRHGVQDAAPAVRERDGGR